VRVVTRQKRHVGKLGHSEEAEGASGFAKQCHAACAAVVTHPLFEQLTMALIAANCVTLALYNPAELPGSAARARLELIELIFNIAFTVEMLMRIVALRGVLSYMSNPWNAFDAFMVLAGYSQFIPTGSSASTGGIRAMRAIRALRPLRTITRFSSLRAIVVCFLEAVPLLVTLMVFLIFLFFLFALAGMLLFQEAYHHACVSDADGSLLLATACEPFACGYRACPAGYACIKRQQAYPATAPGFDNIGAAMLTVFEVTTISGWSYVLYRVQDAVHPAAIIYFVAIIFLCSFFVINLFLAVLKRKFGSAQKYLQARHAQTSPTGHVRCRRLQLLLLMFASSRCPCAVCAAGPCRSLH
jgi:hypothetical protein